MCIRKAKARALVDTCKCLQSCCTTHACPPLYTGRYVRQCAHWVRVYDTIRAPTRTRVRTHQYVCMYVLSCAGERVCTQVCMHF